MMSDICKWRWYDLPPVLSAVAKAKSAAALTATMERISAAVARAGFGDGYDIE